MKIEMAFTKQEANLLMEVIHQYREDVESIRPRFFGRDNLLALIDDVINKLDVATKGEQQ